jgi:lactoylglutathione lyase
MHSDNEGVKQMAKQRTLLNHAGITVSSIEASREFYENVVGMEFYRKGSGSSGEWYDTLTENTGAVSSAVMLKSDDFLLQLVEYHEGGNPDSVAGHHRTGNVHFCINVPDVEAKYAEITALGKYHCTPMVDLPGGGLRVDGMRSFYVRDPDNIPVEFLQMPEDYDL